MVFVADEPAAQDQRAVDWCGALGKRIFRVVDQIDQDLQDFLRIQPHFGNLAIVADHGNVVPFKRGRVKLHGVVQHAGDVDRLDHADHPSIRLLGRDDGLDVVDLRGQQLQLLEHVGPLVCQVHAQQAEKVGQLLALGIVGEKLTKVGGVLLHQVLDARTSSVTFDWRMRSDASVAETLMLLRTLPTLWSTPVAISAIPARRAEASNCWWAVSSSCFGPARVRRFHG